MTMGLIGCRSCDVPSCSGCNLYELEKALRKGYFDAMKVRGGLHICAEVAEVVRCKDCKYWAYEKDLDASVCVMHSISGWRRIMPETAYCSMGVRKEGQR